MIFSPRRMQESHLLSGRHVVLQKLSEFSLQVTLVFPRGGAGYWASALQAGWSYLGLDRTLDLQEVEVPRI